MTGSGFASSGDYFYHPDAMAFAHTVKTQADTAAAWVAVQRKNLPEGDLDDESADSDEAD